MKSLVYALLAFSTVGAAQAQNITGVSDTFNHGATVVITGSSFGAKSTPGPVVWDNLEDGSVNTTATIGTWDNVGAGTGLLLSTESRHSNSHYCATHNYAGTGGDGCCGLFQGPDNVLGEYWYGQYWFKLDNNWTWGTGGDHLNLANVKIARLWNAGNRLEDFAIATQGYAGGNLQYLTENIESDDGGYFDNTANWSLGVWHLFQFEYKESAQGVTDGIIHMWRDGILILDDHSIRTREANNLLKSFVGVGFYDSWADATTDRNDFYLDDVYIDNTWARVELGNAPVYSRCTHREIQVPSAWSNTAISISANLGSFSSLAGTYLFVVSPTGTASPGFALGGDDPGPPGAPSTPIRDVK
jgi:hypothetical protein